MNPPVRNGSKALECGILYFIPLKVVSFIGSALPLKPFGLYLKRFPL
jgi:hypothetical protein